MVSVVAPALHDAEWTTAICTCTVQYLSLSACLPVTEAAKTVAQGKCRELLSRYRTYETEVWLMSTVMMYAYIESKMKGLDSSSSAVFDLRTLRTVGSHRCKRSHTALRVLQLPGRRGLSSGVSIIHQQCSR
jgi:hypothetical protein